MKKLFTLGVLGVILTEVANVYFIMPMPGSQQMRSIDAAYAIYSWRWALRVIFGAMVLSGVPVVWRTTGWRRVLAPTSLLLAALVVYVFNFQMSADHMFLQPTVLNMQPAAKNTVKLNRLVVGVNINGDARAYPLQFIGYHHQVRDSVGGKRVIVSYCTVCRTGRVFEPVIAGRHATFRLVGMDHFNAMLEDRATGSWWRQANGEAVTGSLKGTTLPEIPRIQVTLATAIPRERCERINLGYLDPATIDPKTWTGGSGHNRALKQDHRQGSTVPLDSVCAPIRCACGPLYAGGSNRRCHADS